MSKLKEIKMDCHSSMVGRGVYEIHVKKIYEDNSENKICRDVSHALEINLDEYKKMVEESCGCIEVIMKDIIRDKWILTLFNNRNDGYKFIEKYMGPYILMARMTG